MTDASLILMSFYKFIHMYVLYINHNGMDVYDVRTIKRDNNKISEKNP